MTDHEINAQDVTDAALEGAGVFGYDAQGRKHSYDAGRAQIIVQSGDGVVHVEQVGRHRVVDWIKFVDQEKGGWFGQWWTVQNIAEATKRRRAAEAQAADEQYEQAKQEAV
jgi:hypothetical protein